MAQRTRSTALLSAAVIAAASLASASLAVPAQAQYQQKISNSPGRCSSGPSVRVTVNDVQGGGGTLRVQLYRGTKAEWLAKGRWIYRIEIPARAGTMQVCMPVPGAGTYGIAVRHDVNGNGKTDLKEDGGGMSNNPAINIFNLGKPAYTKTAFSVGDGPKSIAINMRYF